MPITEEELLSALENVLANSSFSQNISQNNSLNNLTSARPQYINTEDLSAGRRVHGEMSSVRRFFSLFVIFDLLFVFLVWLILIMINGDNIVSALEKQIVHYNYHTSLFDIVISSICRFIILLLFYSLIQINHWIVVAITTALTCSFLISKVFLYDWAHSPQPILQVFLILASFVLAWSEAWFLDFRVVPQELYARNYFSGGVENERTPLMRNYLQSIHTESVANFYSPLQSPGTSLFLPECRHSLREFLVKPLGPDEEEKCKKRGQEILTKAWVLINSEDWVMEKESSEGDVIFSKKGEDNSKIFKLKSLVRVSPKFLHEELFDRVESFPSWNPTLLESFKIQTIDEHTDISYQLSSEGGAGIVSSREFINLRHWKCIDDCYVSAAAAFDHPDFPPNNKFVRGENRCCCYVFRPVPGSLTECQFEWLLNTNLRLKSWIPQSVLDTVLMSVMVDYMKYLRRHVDNHRDLENSS